VAICCWVLTSSRCICDYVQCHFCSIFQIAVCIIVSLVCFLCMF
jgi:hypothetical protein